MINIIAYLLSSAIGFLLIRLILGPRSPISALLHSVLAIGLGIGISGILTFLFLLIYGQFSTVGILIIHLLAIAALVTLNIRYVPWQKDDPANVLPKRTMIVYAVNAALWMLAAMLISILSQQYPFGGWDAWALYNMKAKFIIEGGRHWADITHLHWHTQPSYPLLLPLVNSWAFSIFPNNLVHVASMTGVVFSVLCGLLCYAGLAMFISRPVAIMASFLLLTNPFYIFWSTTQYADVLLAYYLLASMIGLVILLKTLQPRCAILAGLMWGIMPMAKNEGYVLFFFFLTVTTALLALDKRYRSVSPWRLIRYLWIGALATNFANIIFKIFMAPPTREVLYNPLAYKLKYFNWDGILTTALFYFFTMRVTGWMFIWGLIAMLLVLNYRKWLMLKESLAMGIVLGGFLLVLLYVYIATAHFDLIWRLQCTASRIIFYLLPAALFFSFYTFWTKKTND